MASRHRVARSLMLIGSFAAAYGGFHLWFTLATPAQRTFRIWLVVGGIGLTMVGAFAKAWVESHEEWNPSMTQRRVIRRDLATEFNPIWQWALVFLFMFTSVPAGMVPVIAFNGWQEMRKERVVSAKWPAGGVDEGTREFMRMFVALAIGAVVVHLLMAVIAFRKRKGTFLGMRGAVWSALLWGCFAAGVALGILVF